LKLNARQKAFCEFYVASGNATDAAIKAGYSERTINAFVELVDEYCGYKGDLNDRVIKNIEQHISDTLSKILTS